MITGLNLLDLIELIIVIVALILELKRKIDCNSFLCQNSGGKYCSLDKIIRISHQLIKIIRNYQQILYIFLEMKRK